MKLVDYSTFGQLISELSQDADDLNKRIDENDSDVFLLGKKDAYCEIFNRIKEITELTDQDISKMRLRFPSYRTIRFEEMDDISSDLLRCFKRHNIQTVGDLAKLNGETIYSVLEMNREYVAMLIALFFGNDIPTRYLNGLSKVCDKHYQEQLQRIEAELDKIRGNLDQYSSDLDQHKSGLNRLKAELEKFYAVTSISYADNEGNVTDDENSPMRLVTVSNSETERIILLSADEVQSKRIVVGAIATITEE